MNNFSKFIVFIVICLALWWGYDTFGGGKFKMPVIGPQNEEVEQVSTPSNTEEPEQKEEPKEEQPKTVETVYIYLLTTDKNGTQFLKPVARELPSGNDKLSFAVNALFNGETKTESSKGIYSEIPSSSKVLSITTSADKVIINVNSAFEYGGGSDSIYSRMRQLIKTALANTNKPVYLHINGRQADIIGGEGISVSQPLSEKSVDE